MILYLGCLVPARLPFIEAAARFAAGKAGLELTDSKEKRCCIEPVGMMSVADNVWEQNVSEIHKAACGEDIITICDGCSLSLSMYGKGSNVSGFMAFLHKNLDAVKAAVVSPLDMDIVAFPGCHCVEVCKKDGKNALKMTLELLEALGARPREPEKNLCCGGNVSNVDDGLSRRIMDEALKSFGDYPVAVTCPFCFTQFDSVARKKTFHIAELAAMAMGWDVDVLAYHRGK